MSLCYRFVLLCFLNLLPCLVLSGFSSLAFSKIGHGNVIIFNVKKYPDLEKKNQPSKDSMVISHNNKVHNKKTRKTEAQRAFDYVGPGQKQHVQAVYKEPYESFQALVNLKKIDPNFFQKTHRRLNIFGKDQRVEAPYRRYPETTVGKLVYNFEAYQQSYCTATLVSREHILTNAHCLFQDIPASDGHPRQRVLTDEWKQSLKFFPAYRDGSSEDYASWKALIYPQKFLDLDEETDEYDWAIIQLDKALGDVFGWMGMIDYDYSDYPDSSLPVNLVGYSNDFYQETAGADYNCHAAGVVDYKFGRQLIHSCATTPGSSGAALFQMYRDQDQDLAFVVGIHRAHLVLNSEGADMPQYHASEFNAYTANLACETERPIQGLLDLMESDDSPAPPYSLVGWKAGEYPYPNLPELKDRKAPAENNTVVQKEPEKESILDFSLPYLLGTVVAATGLLAVYSCWNCWSAMMGPPKYASGDALGGDIELGGSSLQATPLTSDER